MVDGQALINSHSLFFLKKISFGTIPFIWHKQTELSKTSFLYLELPNIKIHPIIICYHYFFYYYYYATLFTRHPIFVCVTGNNNHHYWEMTPNIKDPSHWNAMKKINDRKQREIMKRWIECERRHSPLRAVAKLPLEMKSLIKSFSSGAQ